MACLLYVRALGLLSTCPFHQNKTTHSISNMDSPIKSIWILGVFLLSVVKLKATSVSEFPCEVRNLTVTVDNFLMLYIDGVNITDLPNADDYLLADVVELPCTTKLIAIHGRNGVEWYRGAILASTDDDFILTDSTWKCSNVSYPGWEEIGFDDSTWKSAIEYGNNGEGVWGLIPGISTNASWIWLRQWTDLPNSTYEEMDMEVYCRKRLDPNVCAISNPCLFGATCIDEPNGEYQCICAPGYTGRDCSTAASSSCDHNPCQNGGTCNHLGGDSYSCICPIYATGVTCESPNYNEAYTCGTTLDWSQFNATNGFTRLCYFWTYLEDSAGRFNPCRNTIKGLPLYSDANGLLNAGGNFGCAVSQNYPEDILATRYLSCADNYQQDVYLGNTTESDRLMVCIRYPYEGLPDGK